MCFAHLNDVIIGAESSPTLGASEQDDVSSLDEAEESTTGSNAPTWQKGSHSSSSDGSSTATTGEELLSSLCGLGVPKAGTTDPIPPNSLARQFTQSSWFTRGWILQELLAPDQVIFLDRHWNIIGRKREDTNPLEEVRLGYDNIDEAPSLNREISNITGIGEAYLLDRDAIRDASIAERMSWASRRSTTRIEDMAYYLLGIFNVSMPLLYGEGSRAFLRLQQELIRQTNDQSIFAWWPTEEDFRRVNVEATLIFGKWARYFTTPILAPSPLYFQHSGGISRPAANTVATRPYAITNAGLELRAKVRALRLEDTYSSISDSPEKASKSRLRKRHSKDKDRTYTVKLNCARETYTEEGIVEKKPFEIALHGAASDFPDEVILAARLHCLDEGFWREARRGVGDEEVERERTFYVHALEHYHGKDLAMFPIP